MDWHHLEAHLAHSDNDKRINALAHLRTELEGAEALSEPDSLATLLRPSLKSNNAHVSNAALACLPALFPLVTSDNSASSAAQAHSLKNAFLLLLPLDKLGDTKEGPRKLALEAVVSAAQASLRLGVDAGAGAGKEGPWQVLEKGMQEFGFKSKNPKARAQSLHYLTAIRCPSPESTVPLPSLRPFTPLLLPLLKDGDATVRTLAPHTVISVFSQPSVPAAAKADLKKEMAKVEVPPKVQEQILSAVLGGRAPSSLMERSPSQASLSSVGGRSDSSRGAGGSTRSATSSHPPPSVSAAAPDGPARRTRSQAAVSSHAPSLLASLPAAAFPSDPSAIHAPSADNIAPVYVASERDLRAEFDAMKPGFEGKETEQNWQVRDRSIATIRGMIHGGVARGELQAAFVKAVKEVADGIAKISSSLRTTLATSTLELISELATSLPPHHLDLLLDPFLPHCLGMAGQTKKIIANASQSTVTALLSHSTYHFRTLQLTAQTLAEKPVSARQFAAQHVLAFLRVHGARSKAAIDSTGGADELEAMVRKALGDQNAQVRETARAAFWEFERTWPGRAERVASALDANARKLLDKARPAAGAATPAVAAVEAKKPTARAPATKAVAGAGGAAKKPSVREMMMAARRKKQEEEAANGAAAEPAVDFLPEDLAASPSPAARASSPGGAHIASTPSRLARASLSPTRSTSTAKGGLLSPAADPSPLRSPAAPPQHLDGDDSSDEEGLPTAETPTHANGHANDLMHSPSPFRLRSPLPSATSPSASPLRSPAVPIALAPKPTAMQSNPSHSSLASSSVTSDYSLSRSPHASLVPEAVVDDALRAQAMQAEQAAQRLLELAEDEAEEVAPTPALQDGRAVTPKAPRVMPSGLAGARNAMRTPAMNPARRRMAAQGGKTFEDSPDPRNGDGAGSGTWWMRKADNLPPPPPLAPDSPTRTAEITSLVTSLQSLSIDAPSLRKLSALSKERPVREAADDEDDTLASPSRTGANGHAGSAEEGSTTTSRFWSDERRFEKVYEGLRALLLREAAAQTGMTRDVALLLLKDLVDHQFPCFAGEEAGLFDLLFKLREDPSRTSIAATEAIATLFASRLEPVYGLGSLNPSLSAYLASTNAPADVVARSFGLGLKVMGGFFEGLPAEVLEDVLPGSQELLKRALNDPRSGDLRRAAITALVSAESVLRDEQRLVELIGGLARDQANLLSYYCAKRGV
ncbi:hypothetical protein JCM10213_001152 [Rhodosporidiobolus nylandii]